MAKKQTRRCVSLNRVNYEALKQEAARRGMTITALVELALGALGIPMIEHVQQSPAVAWRAVTSRPPVRGTGMLAERAPREASGNGVDLSPVEGSPSCEWPLLEDGSVQMPPVEAAR